MPAQRPNARLGGGRPTRGPQMYLGGSPNFNESTGQYRGGYAPQKRPQMYLGGSPNFDESTGTYRPGTAPGPKQQGPYTSPLGGRGGYANRPGGYPAVQGQLTPEMHQQLMQQMPTRGAGYFGGGAAGMAQRQDYQADRQALRMYLLNMLQRQRGNYYF